MALGILQATKTEHVPGTALLEKVDVVGDEFEGVDQNALKREPGTGIVLVPQPSDDPDDPFNWSKWKKTRFTIAYAYGCGCVGAVGPLLAPAFVQLSKEFNVTLTLWNIGVQGSLIAMIAVGSLVCNTLAVKYGKRPIYLFTTLMLAITSFWAAEAQSIPSLMAARLVQGFCMAPFEALVPASIADVWFVHQRGYYSAIFNFGVLGGINLAAPISGNIIQYSGFRTTFRAMGGAFVLSLLMVIFWMPETAYHRPTMTLNTATAGESATEGEKTAKAEHAEASIEANDGQPSTQSKSSRWKEYRPYSGYRSEVPLFKTLFRPFLMLLSPVVLWATISFTAGISWLVGISITMSQIFSAPPYNFSVVAVGASNLSSFVATLIGLIVAHPLIDTTARVLSRRNKGVFEPEFRLPIMATYLIFTCVGFFAWGQAAETKAPWPVPIVVCLGLINLGIQLGVTGLTTYVVDCHRQRAGEAFAAMNFVKNLFAFGVTFFLSDWLESSGTRNVFFVIGGVTAACSLTAIPMYIFGKRARAWVHRTGVIGRGGIEVM